MSLKLPTRRAEGWRYSNLAALADVWDGAPGAERTLTVAPGEREAIDDRFAGAGWQDGTLDAEIGAGGSLALRIDARGGPDAVTVQRYRLKLAAGAAARVDLLAADGRLARIEIEAELGDGAAFDLGAALVGRNATTAELVTVVRHAGPRATSRQTVRMAADDMATANYLGRIEVARGAQKTDAVQSVKSLLLSRTATVNAKPELEIFADDVKCAHGASVGALDPQALFYLASRGVDPETARALLLESFLSTAYEGGGAPAQALIEGAVAALRAR